MSQYSPTPHVRRHSLLSRRISKKEYKEVLDYALKLGFRNLFIQEVNEFKLTPDFDREKPFD
jgi:putative pyruvate formate lyase activating enzyme